MLLFLVDVDVHLELFLDTPNKSSPSQVIWDGHNLLGVEFVSVIREIFEHNRLRS